MISLNEIKKILIIRYRFVGDTVLTTPFIKNVKMNFPNAQLDVLVSLGSGELVENNPYVNEVIFFDSAKKHKYERNEHSSSLFKCAMALREKKYDLVFVLKRSFSSALMAFLSRAKYRIGFSTEFRSFLLTHTVKYMQNVHELDNFLNCLKSIGISPVRYVPEIFPTQREQNVASGFLARLEKGRSRVLIHAISAHPYKVWPKRYFANLLDFLHKEFSAQFVFTGTKSDKQVYERIIEWCRYKREIKYLNLCGLTSLRECYAVYQGLDMAICVDSGNAHMAACANVPTYVLYGPTRPEKWLPLGNNVFPIRLNQLLSCQPCDVKVKCDHMNCMKLLTPGFVFNELVAKSLLLKNLVGSK